MAGTVALVEQPQHIIKDGKHHQGQQQTEPQALGNLAYAFRQGASGQNFQRIIQQMPAIQNRNGSKFITPRLILMKAMKLR